MLSQECLVQARIDNGPLAQKDAATNSTGVKTNG
jgi:hypothetical protein